MPTDLPDHAFLRQFAAATLPPEQFTHEAHLRLAWILLDRHGPAEAERLIIEQLRHYVTVVGAADKFNVTLTVAAIRAVDHFRRKATSNDFPGLIAEFPRLKTHFRELMDQHYGFDIYRNPDAKVAFLEPDLLPFT